jgi:hypothetical protein
MDHELAEPICENRNFIRMRWNKSNGSLPDFSYHARFHCLDRVLDLHDDAGSISIS